MKLKKRRLFKIFPKGSKKSHGENDLKKLNHSTKLSNFFTKNCFQGLIPLFKFFKNEILAQVTPLQGPVVRKPINANPRLKINQGVYFSTPKCCTTLIFGKILH